MNILITNRCNRNCPYCFARERISFEDGSTTHHRAPSNITREDFNRAIDFARKSRLNTIGILGGEPSMHPDFTTLLSDAWSHGLRTRVFTNGLWREEQITEITAALGTRPKGHRFIVNMNEPHRSPPGEHERQQGLFAALPQHCSLSFNISIPDFDPTFLVDVILKYRIRPDIRLGVAQPLADMANEHIDIADYSRMVPSLLKLASLCHDNNIRFGFDCGFTLCMFTAEEVGRLILAGARFKASCGPAVDIGTDLSVWACFPLSTFARGQKLDSFENHHALSTFFYKEFDQLYTTGALPECISCPYRKRRQCSGGCAAHVYRKVKP